MNPIDLSSVIVVTNSDLAWSATETDYWATQHGVSVEKIPISFGTACLSPTGTFNDAVWTPANVLAWYTTLIQPVALAAIAGGHRAAFMGPGTPFFVNFPRVSGYSVMALPSHLCCAVGIHRLYQEYGVFPDVGSSSTSHLLYGGSFGVDPYYNISVTPGATELYPYLNTSALPYYRSTYADLASPGKILARFMPGFGEDDEADLATWLTPTSAHMSPTLIGECKGRLFAHPMLTGRIGKPVYRHLGSVSRAAMSSETEARTRAMTDNAIANEGTIGTHATKPVWVGVHRRTSYLTDVDDMAVVDMFKRAGFTTVNYFTRSVPSTAERVVYVPSPVFQYADLPSYAVGLNCWMYFGNALLNHEFGNATTDGDGIAGTDLDALFNWLPGAMTFGRTSFPVHHVLRCAEDADGIGGAACREEPGVQAPKPAEILFALLNGQSAVEAYSYTRSLGGPDVFVGDPLYRPFADEVNAGNIEWWPRAGATPGVTAYIEADPPPPPPPPPPPEPGTSIGQVFVQSFGAGKKRKVA